MANDKIANLQMEVNLKSNIDKGLKAINREMKLTDANAKANIASFNKYDESIESLNTHLTGLNDKMSVNKKRMDLLQNAYKDSVEIYGENSRQAQNYAIQLARATEQQNKMARDVKKANKAIEDFDSKVNNATSELKVLSSQADKSGDDLKQLGADSVQVGQDILASFAVAGGAIAGFSAKLGAEADKAKSFIQASLGTNAEDTAQYLSQAMSVYTDGYGETLDEVARAFSEVKRNMKLVDDTDLANVTKNAMTLANTFGGDVNEVLRAGNAIMTNFKVDSETAFDYLTKSAQRGGNFSGELFDNVAEYSGLFSNMGMDAGQYFQTLDNGFNNLDSTAYNLDYINDTLKEFQIRLKDGSKSTDGAMGQLSKSTQKVWEDMLKGKATVSNVNDAVLTELESMDDQVKASQIGVALYGTKFEDLETTAVYALKSVGDEYSNVSGTMQNANKAIENTPMMELQRTARELKEDLIPLGNTILTSVTEVLEDAKPVIEDVTNFLGGLDEGVVESGIKIGGVATAFGALATVGAKLAPVLKVAWTLFTKLTPIGRVVGLTTAVAGLAIGFTKAKDSIAENTEIQTRNIEKTVESIDKDYEKAVSLDEMAESYAKMREESGATADELLEYKTTLDKLDSSQSAENTKILQDSLKELQTEFGMTADEVNKMLELDAQIQESGLHVSKSFDERGNSVIEYADEVLNLTNQQRELVKAEAEMKINEGLGDFEDNAKQIKELSEELQSASDSYNAMSRAADSYKNQLDVQSLDGGKSERAKLKDLETAYDSLYTKIKDEEWEIAEIQNELIFAKGKEREELQKNLHIKQKEKQTMDLEYKALGAKLDTQEDVVESLEKELKNAEKLRDKNYETFTESKEKLDALNKQNEALTTQYEQYMNILATENGIKLNQEDMIGSLREGLELKKQELANLEQLKANGQVLTEEQEKQLTTLKGQVDTLGISIVEAERFGRAIEGNIADAENLNGELREDTTASHTVVSNYKKIKAEATQPLNTTLTYEDVRNSINNLQSKARKDVTAKVNFYPSFSAVNTALGKYANQKAYLPPLRLKDGTGLKGLNRTTDVIVNDQKGGNYQELIKYPDGSLNMYNERDVFIPSLPKGSVVFNAKQTKSLLSGAKKLATGTDKMFNPDVLSKVNNVVSHSDNKAKVSQNTTTVVADNAEIISQNKEIIGLLSMLVSKNTDVYLDGKKVAETTAPYINDSLVRQDKNNNLRKGRQGRV